MYVANVNKKKTKLKEKRTGLEVGVKGLFGAFEGGGGAETFNIGSNIHTARHGTKLTECSAWCSMLLRLSLLNDFLICNDSRK